MSLPPGGVLGLCSMLKKSYLFGTTIFAGVLAVSGSVLAQNQSNSGTKSQSADANATTTVEEVVVTGSRIPRPQYEGTIPGAQVDRETIETRGFTNAIEILNDLPITGPAVVLHTGTGTPGNAGASYVDLLDLGSQRTLTLVNGRRFVSSNGGSLFVAGNETGNQVDASTIPGALIKRVDVLTVGGAAAYGSDAIAGVINYILRDDFEGVDVRATVSGYEGGQGESYSLSAAGGKNFLDGRLNVTISGDVTHLDPLYSRDFDHLKNNPGLFTNPFGVRNPDFNPAVGPNYVGNVLTPGANPAILPANADGQFVGVLVHSPRTYSALPGGTVWLPSAAYNLTPGASASLSEPISGLAPGSLVAGWYSGNFAPSSPNFCNAGTFTAAAIQASAAVNPMVCAFAPSALPGTNAAQQNANAARVFSAYGVNAPVIGTASGQVTQAQYNAIALGILQSKLPTVREYVENNPGINPLLLAANFVQGLPWVQNNDPATSGLFPRLAAPIRFDDTGNIVPIDLGNINGVPANLGTASRDSIGNYNAADRGVQRIKQQRQIYNVNSRFDITESVQFFTENLYSKIDIETPYNAATAFNAVSSGLENSGVVVSVNHPFLTDKNRADLASRGITNTFVLSTDFLDIFGGENPATATTETFRTVNGLRGDFDVFNRKFGWEFAYSYAGSDYEYVAKGIKDAEFLLAIDAADQKTCRSQTPGGASVVGTSPPGLFPNVVRTTTNLSGGPDFANPRDQLYEPKISQAMIDACKPLNLFGVGRASKEAIDYITYDQVLKNEARQEYFTGSLNGEVVRLPAGPLQFALSAEWRKETLDFGADELSALARGRAAPTAGTKGELTTKEYGVELRIPIVSPNNNIPFVHNLEINPAWRWTSVEGSGANYEDISGVLVSPKVKSETEGIYAIALSYSPVPDVTLRGNVSRAVRNPDLVSLFLGGQPAFLNNTTDPCGSGAISGGALPGVRRKNCEALVRKLNPSSATYTSGVIDASLSDADNDIRIKDFLANYTGTGQSYQTLVSGDPHLKAEIADSHTYGVVLNPRWVPNLTLSVDYLQTTVKGLVSTLTASQANQLCLDSATYPDTRPQTGLDLCGNVFRDPTFAVTNGSISGFWNQGAVRVKALNINGSYGFDVSEMFGDGQSNFGRVGLRASAYHLIEYATSNNGQFDATTTYSQDTLVRPEWEVQLVANYTRGPIRLSWTGNWQDRTYIYTGNGTVRASVDQSTITQSWPSFWQHNATIGYDLTNEASVQFIVNNIFDKAFPSATYYSGNSPQSLGRVLRGQIVYRF